MRSKVDGPRLQGAMSAAPGLAPEATRERVSALMDGESPPGGADATAWEALLHDPQARAAWLEYHRIGDWMRSAQNHVEFDEQAFVDRVGARLRDEPVRFAPTPPAVRGAAHWSRRLPRAGALGASLAAAIALMVMGDVGMQRPVPRVRLAATVPDVMASHRLPAAEWEPGELGRTGSLAWVSLRLRPPGPRSQALGTAPGPTQLHALLSALRYVEPLPALGPPRGNPLR